MSRISVQKPSPGSLGQFVESLIQTFEDRRAGLGDSAVVGEQASLEFFLEIYKGEVPRLRASIADLEAHLADEPREALFWEIDGLLRNVVIPAYSRAARKFTPKERNDFFLTEGAQQMAERIGFGIAGMLIGVFVIVVPFIPLWAKEWIIPFMIAGLLFPEIRRWTSVRRYQAELNRLVLSADREISRLDHAYLLRGESIPEISAVEHEALEAGLRAQEDGDDARARARGARDGQGQGER
ncbi:MAG: hypothetical protein HY791_02675 [Deltaproteobacteria bacterium]|nr:hypothetical protein [Deltaproteobacteria bacterium]